MTADTPDPRPCHYCGWKVGHNTGCVSPDNPRPASPPSELPIYCTGGCDACRDYARELGVPLIVSEPARAADADRLVAGIKAAITVRLIAGETDQTYTPTEVAEMVYAVADEQRVRLSHE